jgi:hypothetical protein
MANRVIYVNDTYPPLRFSLSAASVTLDMTQATSITLHATGAQSQFTGTCVPISPFQVESDQVNNLVVTTSTNASNTGVVEYNVLYDLASTDASAADVFDLYLIVEWVNGQQTFGTNDTLTVLAI